MSSITQTLRHRHDAVDVHVNVLKNKVTVKNVLLKLEGRVRNIDISTRPRLL